MIYHIALGKEWENAKGVGYYKIDSLGRDGFIHCSDKGQIVPVADFLFRGKGGLVLLFIDEDKLKSNVVYEDLYDSGEEFPHVYGKINLDAVSSVVDFLPNADGSFSLPGNLD